MSSRSPISWGASRSAAGKHNPWLVILILSMATFMTVLDTSIANVALLNIAGALGTSVDESTWVLTSYLVANAIVLPISGWLSEVIGRKRFYMLSVGLFSISSLLCGRSQFDAPDCSSCASRTWRGRSASEQAMLATHFHPRRGRRRSPSTAWQLSSPPRLVPPLAAILQTMHSWHWIFFINVPIGALSLALVAAIVDEPFVLIRDREALWRRGLRVDWFGFVLVALWLGFLEIVLDKGQENDWFNSPFITICAIVSAFPFLAFVPWELSRSDPIVDIRLIRRPPVRHGFLRDAVGRRDSIRHHAAHAAIAAGIFGYTATLAGLSLMPGGFTSLVMMMGAGQLSRFVQPRYIMAGALTAISVAMYHFTGLSLNADFSWFAWARAYQMAALPFLFLTITSYSYVGLPTGKSGQASALINVARRSGGSIGVSATQTLLARREQFHQRRLDENFGPASLSYARTIKVAAANFARHGTPLADAQHQAVAWIGQTAANQATLLSYIDAFAALSLVALLLVPAAALLQRVDLGAAS